MFYIIKSAVSELNLLTILTNQIDNMLGNLFSTFKAKENELQNSIICKFY